MSILPSSSAPLSFDEALRAARAFGARDGLEILPQARTRLLACGERTPIAAVLFHGLTNNPAQFAQFAPLLHAHGVNVFVPRLPGHGERDRMTTRIAAVTAEQLLAAASEAVTIAGGLGERVAVLGISMGGLIAAYFAQFEAIDVAVPVAPSFALLRLPYRLNIILGRIALALPNAFVWWDPRLRSSEPPVTAYPRFPTHVLARTLGIGDAVYAAARRVPPLARRIVTIVNRSDPAVNNAVTARVSAAWSARKAAGIEYVELTNLPRMHDIVDPQQPQARTGLVYPRLLEALDIVPQLRPE
jgi:alpha-beta hydrolase superfamily lysophospholipase